MAKIIYFAFAVNIWCLFQILAVFTSLLVLPDISWPMVFICQLHQFWYPKSNLLLQYILPFLPITIPHALQNMCLLPHLFLTSILPQNHYFLSVKHFTQFPSSHELSQQN